MNQGDGINEGQRSRFIFYISLLEKSKIQSNPSKTRLFKLKLDFVISKWLTFKFS